MTGVRLMHALLATVAHDDPAIPQPAVVHTAGELDSVLDLLTAHSPTDAPWIAHVSRANGDCISIGLGKPLLVDVKGDQLDIQPRPEITALSWVQADANPPYFSSRSTSPQTHNFIFFTDGHWTEFEAESAIDVPTARRVLREFVTGTGLPTGIEWTEV